VAAHPDGVVRPLHTGQNRRLRDQRRADRQEEAVSGATRRTEQLDGVPQTVRVLEIDGVDAANAFGMDVGRNDAFAERQRGQQGQFCPGVIAVDIRRRVGFRIPQTLRFG
jgi:hypothetical protein